MKSSSLISRALTLAAGFALCGVNSAHACLTCMGADSTTGPALNGAIFFMLGVLGTVFAGIGAVAFSFWRRARSPLPPHAEFTHSISADGEHIRSI
jgi:hypothetical protein